MVVPGIRLCCWVIAEAVALFCYQTKKWLGAYAGWTFSVSNWTTRATRPWR